MGNPLAVSGHDVRVKVSRERQVTMVTVAMATRPATTLVLCRGELLHQMALAYFQGEEERERKKTNPTPFVIFVVG